jgi:hypothetical protein
VKVPYLRLAEEIADDFRGLRLQELTAALRPCFTAVSSDLNNFIQFLNQLATDDN